MGIMEKVPVKFFTRNFFVFKRIFATSAGTYLIRLNLREIEKNSRNGEKMKGKRVIAGILLAGISNCLAGCKNADVTKKEREKPVITLGSDSYPPYNYLNEDGIPTGIDVELATEAFRRMGYQVDVVQINWEKKKDW